MREGHVDFFCIGAQKAGTSWLWEALRRHPRVFSPPVKELHYYDHLHRADVRPWTGAHLRRGVRRALRWHVNRAPEFDRDWIGYLLDLAQTDPFTPDWYARAFARAPEGSCRVEVTPEYAGLPPEGIAHLFHDNPGATALMILRDPVDRALSQIRMGFARRRILRPGREDWRRALDDPDLAERADYRRHLDTWRSVAPPGRLVCACFDQLRKEPELFLTRIESRLGLPPGPRPAELSDPVHAGPPIDPPFAVRAGLEIRLAPQRAAMIDALAALA